MMPDNLQNAVQEFRKESEAAGHVGRKAMCSYLVNVTYNERETQETKERLLHYFQGILPAFPSNRTTAPPQIGYFLYIADRIQIMNTGYLGERSIITGSPEDCLKVLIYSEKAGIEEVILYFRLGGRGHRKSWRLWTELPKSNHRISTNWLLDSPVLEEKTVVISSGVFIKLLKERS